VLLARLKLKKDENQLLYLAQCYRRASDHLYVKQKLISEDKMIELQGYLIGYFCIVLGEPENVDLENPSIVKQINTGFDMFSMQRDQIIVQRSAVNL